jgi:hypothetical protein
VGHSCKSSLLLSARPQSDPNRPKEDIKRDTRETSILSWFRIDRETKESAARDKSCGHLAVSTSVAIHLYHTLHRVHTRSLAASQYIVDITIYSATHLETGTQRCSLKFPPCDDRMEYMTRAVSRPNPYPISTRTPGLATSPCPVLQHNAEKAMSEASEICMTNYACHCSVRA